MSSVRMETTAFEQVMRGLRPRLLHRARSLLHDDGAAEDAVQDTLLRLWEVRHDERFAARPEPLAFAILHNRCLDQHRARRGRMPLEGTAGKMASQATADAALEEADNATWLSRRISQLPEAVRRMWKMKQQDGMETAQIARLLGISERSVRNAISQVRRRLAQELIKRNQQ